VFAEKKFKRASWTDFRTAFERRAGHGPCCTLEGFFDQWIDRAGAPKLALKSVARRETNGRWQVTGTVVQDPAHRLFDLPAVLRVETEGGTVSQVVSLHDRKTGFSLTTVRKPAAVTLDPDADVFRRLYPEEIPASINSIKGAASVSVVVSAAAGPAGRSTAQMLVRALGLSDARIVEETAFEPETEAGSRVYIGFPTVAAALPPAPAPVVLSSLRFSVGDRHFSEPTDTFFGVFDDPRDKGNVVGLLYPVDDRYGPLVARKATHYGKYSYLSFRKGTNAAKGVWPVTASPLMVKWE
jgi:hypothetical protein